MEDYNRSSNCCRPMYFDAQASNSGNALYLILHPFLCVKYASTLYHDVSLLYLVVSGYHTLRKEEGDTKPHS